ncbi:MAG: hypothetical protein L0Y43_07740, partial [Methylococcaceae bacterium]|nr:hypothetical protein [Methylococcaceae bacterium]
MTVISLSLAGNILAGTSDYCIDQPRIMDRFVIVSSGHVQRWLTPLVAALFFLLAMMALRHLLQDINYPVLFADIKATPSETLLFAVCLTIAGYIVFVGYDLSALAYIGRKLSLGLVAA